MQYENGSFIDRTSELEEIEQENNETAGFNSKCQFADSKAEQNVY